MAAIHQTAKQLGVAFQITSTQGAVHVRSHGDALTNAGQLAVVAAAQTYYGGLSGGTVVGPPTASAAGAASQPPILSVAPGGIDLLCKPGDEPTVAASLTTVLNVSANTTHNVTAGNLFGTVT